MSDAHGICGKKEMYTGFQWRNLREKTI